MSRCFPYQPMRNVVPSEALIESIKLQTKTGRSKEKREKKEKRKGKKINEQPSKVGDAKISMSIDSQSSGEKCSAEALEKSDVTEEHGLMDSETSCYLSDSTRSSNKRKMHNPPSSCSPFDGNIIRIRLPPQKTREPNVLLIEDRQCTTFGSQELPFNNLEADTDIKKVSEDKIPHSTSEFKPHKDERRWAKLMDVLVPQTEQNHCDDEWLLEAKPSKRCRSDNYGVLCNRSAALTLWPSAHYLPVADIHVLPYTVLF